MYINSSEVKSQGYCSGYTVFLATDSHIPGTDKKKFSPYWEKNFARHFILFSADALIF